MVADQLIAVAQTDDGTASLSQQAGLAVDETRRLVAETQAVLSAMNAGRSDFGAVDTRDYGTGALRPDE